MATSIAYVDSALVCSNATASNLSTSNLDALHPAQRVSSIKKRRINEEEEEELRYPSYEFFERERHQSKRRRLSFANDSDLSDDDVILQTPPTRALSVFEHVCTTTCIPSWMQGLAGARCQYPAFPPPHRPPPLPKNAGSSASFPADLNGCASFSELEHVNPNSLSDSEFTNWLNTKFPPPHRPPPIEELTSSFAFGSSIETEFTFTFTTGSLASRPIDLTTSSSTFDLETISDVQESIIYHDVDSEDFIIAPPPTPMFVDGDSDDEGSYVTEDEDEDEEFIMMERTKVESDVEIASEPECDFVFLTPSPEVNSEEAWELLVDVKRAAF